MKTKQTKPKRETKAAPKKPAKKAPARKVAAKKDAKPVEHADHLTKGGTILELIQRKGGATSAELMQATGWQRHSVRGYISAVVTKKLGLKVTTGKNDAGEHTYAVAK